MQSFIVLASLVSELVLQKHLGPLRVKFNWMVKIVTASFLVHLKFQLVLA